MAPVRFENKRLTTDRPVVKILFVLSCLVIAGVVLYFAGGASIYAIFFYASRNGVVRTDTPAYGAIDEQSLLELENAQMRSENLSALAATDHRIVRIAPKTRVRYKSKSFYGGQKLSPELSNDPSAQPILRVTVLTGPEKGRTVWIAERDVGFYAAL